MDGVFMDKSDVTIEEIDEECEDCTVGPPTHVVMMDVRSLGQGVLVGRFCEPCAREVARRIQDGLPDADDGK
mgnify:CR=1 FL=1